MITVITVVCLTNLFIQHCLCYRFFQLRLVSREHELSTLFSIFLPLYLLRVSSHLHTFCLIPSMIFFVLSYFLSRFNLFVFVCAVSLQHMTDHGSSNLPIPCSFSIFAKALAPRIRDLCTKLIDYAAHSLPLFSLPLVCP